MFTVENVTENTVVIDVLVNMLDQNVYVYGCKSDKRNKPFLFKSKEEAIHAAFEMGNGFSIIEQ